MKLSAREKTIFVACVLTAAVYLFYSAVYQPMRSKMKVLDSKIVKYTKQLLKYHKALKSAPLDEQKYAAYHQALTSPVPQEQVMSELFSEIEKASAQLDLKISDLKPRRLQEDEIYQKYMVGLTIDSDYLQVLEFVHILQSDPYSYDLVELRMNKAGRRSDEIKTQLVLGKRYLR